jgi:hypothetical protein
MRAFPTTTLIFMSETNDPLILVRAPRFAWMELLLHLATFGIYTSIWFLLRTRELNRIAGSEFKPWRWFFAPVVIFIQIIALPKFFAVLRNLEDNLEIPSWSTTQERIWIGAVATTTVAFQFSGLVDLFDWKLLFGLLVWSGLFSLLQPRINRILLKSGQIQFSNKVNQYTPMEWVFLVPLLPLVIALPIFITVKPYLDIKQNLENGYVYVSPNKDYQVIVRGDGWGIAKEGSVADSQADLALQGPLAGNYFAVYKYGSDETVNSISHWRMKQAQESLGSNSCAENRILAKNQTSVISHILCKGHSFDEPAMVTITLIETNNGIFELYGEMSAGKLSYPEHEKLMLRMAEGFGPT